MNDKTARDWPRRATARFCLCLLLLTLLGWLTVGAVPVSSALEDMVREQRPDSWRQDAAINDIYFVDPQHGWAVGNQGLILRTTDGGRNWLELDRVGMENTERSLLTKLNRLQPVSESNQQNPIRCQWHSIHFVDSMNGWITGSYQVPYVDRSRAIVMRSADGGVSWVPMLGVVLPRINRLNFQSRTDGWAVGQAGNLYKTGIFHTRNGGQSWSTEGATRLPGWLDADAVGDDGLVTVSLAGKLGVVRGPQYEPSVILCAETPRLRVVRMLDEKNGWAAGDQGALLRTRDGGASWRPVDTSSIAEINGFDLTSLSLVGNRLYLAGDPGTYLFSLDTDSGELKRHRTPVRTRIRKVYFASTTHGWAVGDLGSILATRDAGQTWTVQRKGADRVGALMVSVDPDQLPLEMIARFSGEENILSSALCLRSQAGLDVVAATSRLGASTAQSIPGDLDVHSPDMLRRLVRELRAQQPNLVVANEDPSGRVDLTGLLREAIDKAADRSQFVTQLTEHGLTTWQVDRLVYSTPQRDSEIRVDGKKLLPRVGHLVEDYVAISRAQLDLPIRYGSQATKHYMYKNYASSFSIRNGDPFSGLRSNGSTIPRRKGVTRMGNLNAINRASTKQRQFDHLLSCEINSPREHVYWRQQIQAFGLGLESNVLGVWMMQLADQYVELGKSEMAAYTLEQMVNRLGDHALSPSALLWLSQYYSSDEFHWQQLAGADHPARGGRALPVTAETPRSVARTMTANGTTTLVWEPLPEEPEETSAVVPASHEEAASVSSVDDDTRKQRLSLASRFLGRLKRLDPDLGLDTRVRFLEAQILQKMQGPTLAKNQFRALVRASQEMDPVALAASREMVLADQGPLPSDRLRCPRAESRPRLDGQLDDALWQDSMAKGEAHFRPLGLAGKQDDAKPDLLMLAHDDEFLFIAVRCSKIPGQSYHVSRVPRQRDQDLSLRDRLEITLDVDRDYRSSYKFVVDHRGWAGESVGGSVGWNPQWFIDQSQNETSWIVELAIPLAELTGRPILPGAVMAARVNRLSYDSSSLWESERSRQAAAGQPSGLLNCLEMHPGSFQLLEFE